MRPAKSEGSSTVIPAERIVVWPAPSTRPCIAALSGKYAFRSYPASPACACEGPQPVSSSVTLTVFSSVNFSSSRVWTDYTTVPGSPDETRKGPVPSANTASVLCTSATPAAGEYMNGKEPRDGSTSNLQGAGSCGSEGGGRG